MEVRIRLEDWSVRAPVELDNRTGCLNFAALDRWAGVPGVYLLEAVRGRRVLAWYVGQAGDLAGRLRKYGLAAAKDRPDSRDTTERVAGRLRQIGRDGGSIHYQAICTTRIELPDRIVDEHGEPLSWITDLKDTGLRLMVEGAAVVHRTETIQGGWEQRLNVLPTRAGSINVPASELETVVLADFDAAGGADR